MATAIRSNTAFGKLANNFKKKKMKRLRVRVNEKEKTATQKKITN